MEPENSNQTPRRPITWLLLTGLLAIFIFLNFIYLILTALPYPRSDDWYFIDSVLIPWRNGDLRVTDLFMSRGIGDHLQPVQKGLFILNAELFSLDMRFPAVIGWVCSLAIFLMLSNELRLHSPLGKSSAGQKNTRLVLMLFLLGISWFSFNSTMYLSWPLATLWYLPYLFCVLLFAIVSAGLRSDRVNWFGLVVFASVMMLVADDVGYLAITSLTIGLLTCMVWGHQRKKATYMLFGALAIALAYSLLKEHAFLHAGGGGTIPVNLGWLISNPGSVVEFTLLAMANTLVFSFHYRGILGEWAQLFTLMLGSVVLLTQLALVASFFAIRANKTSMLPIFLMVFYWLLLAGVLIIRVPEYGADYANQPRYSYIYNIGLGGMVLLTAWLLDPSPKIKKASKQLALIAAACAVLFFLLQAIFIDRALREFPYIRQFNTNTAASIERASAPASEERIEYCVHAHPPERCREMARFLKREHLSVFRDDRQESKPHLTD